MNAYDLVRRLREFRWHVSGGVFHLLHGATFVSNMRDKQFDCDLSWHNGRGNHLSTIRYIQSFLAQLSLWYYDINNKMERGGCGV